MWSSGSTRERNGVGPLAKHVPMNLLGAEQSYWDIFLPCGWAGGRKGESRSVHQRKGMETATSSKGCSDKRMKDTLKNLA